MTLTFQLAFRDFRRRRYYRFFRDSTVGKHFVRMTLSMILALVSSGYLAWYVSPAWLAITLLFSAVLSVMVYILVRAKFRNDAGTVVDWERHPMCRLDITCSLDAMGFTYASKYWRYTCPWNAMRAVGKGTDAFYFEPANGALHIVPKRALGDDATLRAFEEVLSTFYKVNR